MNLIGPSDRTTKPNQKTKTIQRKRYTGNLGFQTSFILTNIQLIKYIKQIILFINKSMMSMIRCVWLVSCGCMTSSTDKRRITTHVIKTTSSRILKTENFREHLEGPYCILKWIIHVSCWIIPDYTGLRTVV